MTYLLISVKFVNMYIFCQICQIFLFNQPFLIGHPQIEIYLNIKTVQWRASPFVINMVELLTPISNDKILLWLGIKLIVR